MAEEARVSGAGMKLKDSVCACDECKNMCRTRPCWGTPAEAKAIIDAGFGTRLMVDWWEADDKDPETIRMLQPAIKGSEGGKAPWWPLGPCTFLTDAGRCELHDLGLKPTEGRLAHHEHKDEHELTSQLHEEMAASWENAEAQQMVEDWRHKP